MTFTPTHAPTTVAPATTIDLSVALTSSQGFAIFGGTANDRSGYSVSTAGDVNKDGYSDIIIGAFGASPSSRLGAGASYVIYGSAANPGTIDLSVALTSAQGFAIWGGAAYDLSGSSVSSAGDVNKDSYSDIIIGAWQASPNSRSGAGASYVIYGSAANPGTIDLSVALTSAQGFAIYGGTGGDQSGYSVSAAGDVNKDGYADIIIGANQASPNSRTYAGESYVIYGSAVNLGTVDLSLPLNGTRGFAIWGGAADDYSGSSVSAAGDVNKDGYADLIIGANIASPNSRTNAGESYVIYGSAANPGTIDLSVALTSSQGFAIYGGTAQDRSGYSVSTAGDINKDGYSDILIGAFYASPSSRSHAGESYVIYGSAANPGTIDLSVALSSAQGFKILGGAAGDNSGDSVSTAGDFNNDGYSDIIIGGAQASPSSRSHAGESYVIYGSATNPGTIDLLSLTSAQGFAIYGGAPGDTSGNSVSIVGDVNKDGYADVIIGAYYASPNSRTHAGESYVIYGSRSAAPTSQPSAQPSRQPSEHPSEQPSSQPSERPTDQPTSQPTSPTAQPSSQPTILEKEIIGLVDLAKLTHYQGICINGKASHDSSGSSVSYAGDVNNDGYGDVIIGAPQASPFSKNNAGGAFIVYGSYGGAIPLSINLATSGSYAFTQIYGANTGDQCGLVVSNAGDYNKDGYADVIVSCYMASPNLLNNAGAIYIVYGGKNLNTIDLGSLQKDQGFVVFGANSYDFIGFSTASAGDVNNDGYADVVMGAPQASPNSKTNAGIVYVLLGKANQNNIDLSITAHQNQTIQIQGANSGDNFGYSLSGEVDFNNDHHSDLIIGASYASDNDKINSGTTYVIFGNFSSSIINLVNFNLLQGIKIFGSGAGDYSGSTVSHIGDFNQDGFADLMIGAPFASPLSRIGAGTIYALYGLNFTSDIDLANLEKTSGVEIYGANPNDNIGKIANYAGDINNDGYGDIIIGIPQDSYFSRNKCGETYAVYGSSSPINFDLSLFSSSKGIFIAGANALDSSGISVSNAGDFNNDGFSDLIVGASDASPSSKTKAGSSYILYGGYNAPTSQPSRQPSSQPSDQPSGLPTDQPTSRPTRPSAQPTLSPTQIPTQVLTQAPTEGGVINNYGTQSSTSGSLALKYGLSAVSFVLSAVGTWFFRTKIAFYVLDNWGHRYKFIYNYKDTPVSINNNEIGIYLEGSKLFAIIRGNKYEILIDDSNHHGVSNSLYDVIVKQLQNPSDNRFALIQHEKNQLRSFLVNHHYLSTTTTFCFLSGYKELGYAQGTVYNLILQQFEEEHSKVYKKQVRPEISGEISMKVFSTNVDNENSIEPSSIYTSNPITKDQSADTPLDDVENHATMYSVHSVIHNNPLLNHPKSSEIFKYTYEIGGTKAVNILLDYQGYVSNNVNEIKDTIKEIFADNTPSANKIANAPTKPIPTAGNMHSSPNNNLMISLLTAQQIIEYIPIIKYIAQGLNLSLPEVLDNKPILISTHLVLGNAAAVLLPYESLSHGMITSTIATSSYAMRLVSAGYLSEQRQEALTQDKPMSNFEMAKYCGASMLAYTLPSIAKCAVTKWFIPEAECSFIGYDISISASLGGADCYAMYKATNEPSVPTTADVVVPYILDAIAFSITSQYVALDMSSPAMAMQSVQQCMSVVSTVVATDYMSRVVMDMVPMKMKESYVEPAFDYVEDVYAYGTSYFS